MIPSLTLSENSPLFKALGPRKFIIKEAAISALSRVGDSTQVQVVRAITSRYALSSAYVRERVSGRIIRVSELSYGITGRRKKIPFTDEDTRFKPQQTKIGVKVTIIKGKRTIIPHAFFAEVRGTKGGSRIGVFIRRNTSRWSIGRPHTSSPNLPIYELRAPSIFTIIRSRGIKAMATEYFRSKLPARLWHEIDRRLKATS